MASAFGISVGMAQLLLAARGWTVARLDQALRLYGRAFSDHVWPTPDETHDRLDRIETLLAEILNDLKR